MSQSQKLKPIVVTVAVAGTAQRVVTDAASSLRFTRAATFVPFHDNAGIIFIGDADVADDNYSASLDASKNQNAVWDGDYINIDPANRMNYIDLYETWVDSSENGDIVFVSQGIL